MKSGLSRLVLAMIIPFAVLAAPVYAAERITNEAYTVVATNDEWTPTNIKVSPGDILITNEPGNRITVGAYLGSADANGLNNGIGALLIKIGVGSVMKIGKRNVIIVNDSGVVKLRIHDTNYADNSGSYHVSIIRIPAALIPPEQTVDVAQ